MKIKNNLLSFFHNSTDKSRDLNIFGLDTSLTLLSTDNLYMGFDKPINQVFIEVKVANTNSSAIIIQKWNGSSWVNINLLDETNGYKKSGFVYFDEDDKTSKTTLNGIEKYWLNFKVSANTSAMVLNGINLVFNNLEDLRIQEPAIERFFPREIQSHILSCVAARDYILRRINNAQPYNYYAQTIDASMGINYINIVNFTQFDLFDLNEIRDAATFYALHKIFSNRSDDADDVYKQKALDYMEKFESSFKLFQGRKLTIDIDRDGVETAVDKTASIRTISLMR